MTTSKKLQTVFANLEDPRVERTKKHPLMSIIFLAVCSAMAGIDEWVGMQDYCEENFDYFSEQVDFPEGVPSHDTISRVMSKMDVANFHSAFVEFTQMIASKVSGVTAIDGKTARGSSDATTAKSALHSVSAWSSSNNLVLAQIAVEEKSNEITAIPKLLDMLNLEGEVITIDAMGCQRNIASKILDKQADYVLSLKGNQGTLHEDIQLLFEGLEQSEWQGFKGDYFEESDKGHGRIETRRCWVTSELGCILSDHNWPGLESVAMVESNRTIKGKTSKEKRFYITSLPPLAKRIATCIRSHWGIENKVHWVLDVTFNEDRSQIRKDNGAEIMNITRKWSLNILNQLKGKLSMHRMQSKVKMSIKRLHEVLNSII